MRSEDCDRIEPMLGAYALEALDLDEQTAVRAHLASCESCQAALEGYRAVADALLMAPTPLLPSPRLRSRLISRLDRARRSRGGLATPGYLPRLALAVGMAALLLVNLSLLWQVRSLRVEQARVAQDLQVDQTALSLASYPSTQVVLLEGESVGGTFLYEPERRFAVLHMWGLDPLESGQEYQAWLVRPDGSRVSGGVFAADPNSLFTSAVLNTPGPVGEFSGLGVTVEPAGGSLTPTGPRVLSADL